MHSLDRTYGELILALQPEQQAVARDLFRHLGIDAVSGFGWDRFFQLGPNRDLPSYAVLDDGGPGLPLAPFVRAHHCFAFHGLLADRLADRQAHASAELVALEKTLRAVAIDQLSAAYGDGRRVHELAEVDHRRWAEGVAREQAALGTRALTLEAYCDLALLKLDWVGTSAFLYAERRSGEASAEAFRVAHRLLLLSLQCLDDASDVEDDRRCFGSSVPEALRLPAGGLVRASGRLAAAASRLAREAGFSRFGAWLDERAAHLGGLSGPGAAVRNEMAGLAIAGILEERCLAGLATSC